MSDEIKLSIETITPEHARDLLQNQVRSRHIRHATVARYADAMRNGEWVFNDDTIKILSDGQVYDGIHRLYACIQADAAFETLVVRGIDPDISVIKTYLNY